jgi:hypothetical protein
MKLCFSVDQGRVDVKLSLHVCHVCTTLVLIEKGGLNIIF